MQRQDALKTALEEGAKVVVVEGEEGREVENLNALGNYLKGAARGEKPQPRNRHERRAEATRAKRKARRKHRKEQKSHGRDT